MTDIAHRQELSHSGGRGGGAARRGAFRDRADAPPAVHGSGALGPDAHLGPGPAAFVPSRRAAPACPRSADRDGAAAVGLGGPTPGARGGAAGLLAAPPAHLETAGRAGPRPAAPAARPGRGYPGPLWPACSSAAMARIERPGSERAAHRSRARALVWHLVFESSRTAGRGPRCGLPWVTSRPQTPCTPSSTLRACRSTARATVACGSQARVAEAQGGHRSESQ